MKKKVKCVELVTDILDMVLTLSLKTEWGGGKGEVTVLKKKRSGTEFYPVIKKTFLHSYL